MKLRIIQIALLITLLSGVSILSAYGQEKSLNELTVMSYNIQIGANSYVNPEWKLNLFDLDKVAEIIKTQSPDVVLLQEVDRFNPRSAYVDQPQRLADLLGMHWSYGRTVGKDDSDNSAKYGIAILSKYPLAEEMRHPYPPFEDKNGVIQEPRVALADQISWNGQTVNLVCTHFGLSEKEREIQCESLLSFLKTLQGPIILGGDFNSEIGSREMAPLAEKYQEAFGSLHLGKEWSLSFPSGLNSTVDIDHFFFTSDILIHDVKVVHDMSHASDHNPIVARISLKPE